MQRGPKGVRPKRFGQDGGRGNERGGAQNQKRGQPCKPCVNNHCEISRLTGKRVTHQMEPRISREEDSKHSKKGETYKTSRVPDVCLPIGQYVYLRSRRLDWRATLLHTRQPVLKSLIRCAARWSAHDEKSSKLSLSTQ